MSLPPRERELKQLSVHPPLVLWRSLPPRERELKQRNVGSYVSVWPSLPPRERELKLGNSKHIDLAFSRSPRGSVN